VLPVVNASIPSKLTWSWFFPLLKKGYEHPLEADDLYILPPDQQAQNLAKTFFDHWNIEKKKKSPSILRSLFKSYGKQWVFAGLMRLLSDLSALIGPLLLSRIISFVKDPDQPTYVGLLYAGGMILSTISKSFFQHHWLYNGLNVGMKSRSSVVNAIYSKAFVLSPESGRVSTVGEMVNLQAIDAQRIQELCSQLHQLWAAPLQTLRIPLLITSI